jgi:cytochrome b6-f complex iron-sulfur subunit
VLKNDEAFPIAERGERALDRRRFLGFAGCAALLAVTGELAARRVSAARPSPLAVSLAEDAVPGPGEAVELASSDRREALVVKLDSGDLVAFDRRCPHLGCPVQWAAERARFECPCHHAAFDARTGRVLFGPPRQGLEPARLEVASAARGLRPEPGSASRPARGVKT